MRFIYGNTDEIGLHNKENKDILEQKTLNFSNLWYANTLFLYNIIIQKQHQNNEEETAKKKKQKTNNKKTVSCKYLKISLSESYKVVLITSHYVQVNFL